MKKREYELHTKPEGLYSITAQVRAAVRDSGVQDGICIVFCPHTTAGITVNENADPDVAADILYGLRQIFPERPEYRHMEGNTNAHLKASYMGSSATILIEDGELALGVWQGIYFCEFDGPRRRRYYIKILGDGETSAGKV